jgi:hypothetical protein
VHQTRGEPTGDLRETLRRRVCAVCLDGADDGRCGLASDTTCPMLDHLPGVISAIDETRAHNHTGYARVVEARVCSRCVHRDALGLCRRRQDARCALWLYLPLIVEATAPEPTTGPSQATDLH